MKFDQASLSKIETFIDENVAAEPAIDSSWRHFRVKNFTVKPEGNQWAVFTDSTLSIRFRYRTWAVAWAVGMANNNLSICAYLVKSSRRHAQLLADRTLYQHYFSKIPSDSEKLNRLQDRLQQADSDIQELVWETHQVLRYQGFV